jgi:hypothetical protein
MRRALLCVTLPVSAVSCQGGDELPNASNTDAQRNHGKRTTENPLLGTWIITETTVTQLSGTSVNENPQPGLVIFTDRHFSIVLIPGGERAPFSADRTDTERLAAYDNLIVDAGTYERTDSTFTIANIVAKVPSVMPPHSTGNLTFGYSSGGDADFLILTLRGGWAPPDGQLTYRLRRLE